MGNLENRIKEFIRRADQNALGVIGNTRTVSSDTKAKGSELLLVDSSGGDITITLPSPIDSLTVAVKKISDDNNVVTVATPSTEQIDGVSQYTITNQFVSEQFIGTEDKYFTLD
jgi:hypothetical protein